MAADAVSTATESYNGTSWTSTGSMTTARHGLGGSGTQSSAFHFHLIFINNPNAIKEWITKAKEIQAKLNELRNEYKAKKIIVDRFQKIFDEYKKQKAEEDKLYSNEALVNKALSTADKGIQAREFSTTYEAASKN